MDLDNVLTELQERTHLDLIKMQAVNLAGKIFLAVVVFIAGWIVIGYLKKLFNQLVKRGRIDKALTKLLGSVLSFVGWIVTVAAIFKVLGFTEVSLAFSGSIALIAMGLANSASSIVGDLFSGVSLIADNDFQIGSRVTVAGITGTVEGIDMRKTRIRDDSGNLFILPNRNIDNATITIAAVKKAEDKSAS